MMSVLIAYAVLIGTVAVGLLVAPWVFALFGRYMDWVDEKTRRN